MESVTGSLLDCGVAMRPLAGQDHLGDDYLVEHYTNGALVSVADGLGHGAEAAEAARAACALLKAHAQESVVSLIQQCHAALRATRGAVISLASLNSIEGSMSWLGVGDVQGFLLRADPEASRPYEALLSRPGVVGQQLPRLTPASVPIRHGDTLLLLTDGIEPVGDWLERSSASLPPQAMAERILAYGARDTDDALVLVARYEGRTR